jgi:chemotaxis protein MotB
MSEGEGNRPIIIVKKKRGHGGHHGGAWKVAYADFVTAMMAFFLVMWLVAQSSKVKNSVASYFKDPDAFAKNAGILPGGLGLNEGAGPKPKTVMAGDLETAMLEKAASKLKGTLEQTKVFAAIKSQVEISVTKDGLEIQLLEKANQVLFDVGSTVPKEFTRTVLAEIGREIGQLPNKVVISGHTDRRPYQDEAIYSNWELSCERANSTRRVMAENGLRGEQIARVAGFADTMPRTPQDPFAASNRRISILVLRTQISVPLGGAESGKGEGESTPGAAPASAPPASPSAGK